MLVAPGSGPEKEKSMENTEVVDVTARKHIASLCGLLNSHAAFLDVDSTDTHRQIEAIRIDLGDDDLAAHVEKRAKAEAERATNEEKERAVQKNKDNDIAKLKSEMEFLKKQLADSQEKNAEIAELRAAVEKLTAAGAAKK
jgi:hypothetical protein